ncbi:MAG: ELWxxDGT repeat protein, partial [Planctomycetia bacterium]
VDVAASPTKPDSVSQIVEVNGNLFVTGTNAAVGTELWRFTPANDRYELVADVQTGAASGLSHIFSTLVNVNGTLFFTANNGANGFELWKSDGTAAGTVQVKDIFSGSTNSNAGSLTNVDGVLFFSADDGVNGRELWKSDGTSAGTVMVKNFGSGATSGNVGSLANVGGFVYFSADDGATGQELWKSNGTSAGTVLVADIRPSGPFGNSSNPSWLLNVGGTLFFSAHDSVGIELWKSDGTSGGTVRVKDIFTGTTSGFPNSSKPAFLTNVGGAIYFRANDGSSGFELWKSDGTAAGTVLLKDVNPGPNDGFTPHDIVAAGPFFTNVDGVLYFLGKDGANDEELWKSDGTSSGTFRFADIRNGGSGNPTFLTNVNGNLYFIANDGSSGVRLWRNFTDVDADP